MSTFKSLVLFAALGLAGTAEANFIQHTVSVLDTDPGSVGYVFFTVDVAGHFDISAEGADTFGAGYNPDPQIYLFSAPLSDANFIISDDDGGTGYNALLSGLDLAVGDYVLAVSQSVLSLDEAVTGQNATSVYDPGPVVISISSPDGHVVPEPTSLALLAIGAAALGGSRHKAHLKSRPSRC